MSIHDIFEHAYTGSLQWVIGKESRLGPAVLDVLQDDG
jgi:hypothetical protein